MLKQGYRWGRLFIWLLVVLSLSSCASYWFEEEKSNDPNAITFKRTYGDALRGDRTRLKGWLKKPAGNGPFPAVVMLIDTELRAPGDREWEERLVSWGYVVLHVDSMGSRGIALYDYGPEHFWNLYWLQFSSRAGDALDAKKYLASLPYVKAGKIGVMGWSYGAVALFTGALEGDDPFQAAVSFYGICGHPKAKYNAALMIMYFEGPSKFFGNTCRSSMAVPGNTRHEITYHIYPVDNIGYDLSGERWLKFYHNFAQEYHRFIPFIYNREAAEDSIKQVRQFLGKYLM